MKIKPSILLTSSAFIDFHTTFNRYIFVSFVTFASMVQTGICQVCLRASFTLVTHSEHTSHSTQSRMNNNIFPWTKFTARQKYHKNMFEFAHTLDPIIRTEDYELSGTQVGHTQKKHQSINNACETADLVTFNAG